MFLTKNPKLKKNIFFWRGRGGGGVEVGGEGGGARVSEFLLLRIQIWNKNIFGGGGGGEGGEGGGGSVGGGLV